MTLKTPSGRPASFIASAIQIAADGSFSLGFSTTVLPSAIAIGKNHIGTIAGKLNGLMMPTTPTGSCTEYTSTPVETFWLNSPFARCGMPQANSMTSRPRAISPSASEVTLPCSLVRIAARSPLRALTISRKAKSTCWRFAQLASAHAGRAALAAWTATSTSRVEARRTSFWTTPRAGL